ncbi:hypothetical protein EDEG_02748 [Edhazardia aedis USNM 41457]|uniref:Uncharacterized protein n=1 Tax=Edhazardia aedis (strain USNM 41457) TaxID=1003232 RepID=J8ZT69_EDHAE|nr:hypothetical protein EDEG_02748 [Edhazardia aedis USNM 41457]|eukprot:EJW02868.1 hypothetical protein EDEG_02748 [Edhazardia aedis USNM 41457]
MYAILSFYLHFYFPFSITNHGLKTIQNEEQQLKGFFQFISFNSPIKKNSGYICSRYQDSPQWPSTQRSHPPNRPGTLPNSKSCGQTDGHRHIISRSEEVSLFNSIIKYGIGHGHTTYIIIVLI